MTTLKISDPAGLWLDAGLEITVGDEQLRRREGMLKKLKKDSKAPHAVSTEERVFFKMGEEIGYDGPQSVYMQKQCAAPITAKAAPKAAPKHAPPAKINKAKRGD